jgi:hypothetical protein
MLTAGLAGLTATGTLAASPVPVSGGSPAQQRVARVLLAQLHSPRITGVAFVPHAHPPGITNGQRMDVSGADRTVRTYWDENLFVAAFVRESNSRGIPEPKLAVMNGDSFVAIHGPGPPGPRASARVVAGYVAGLRSAAASAKAQVVSVEVLRPGHPIGVALTLKVADPAAFLKQRVSRLLPKIEQPPTGIFARYIGLQDPSGTLVWEVGLFPGSSRSSIAPSLQGCDPTPHTMPVGRTTPSCPG